MTSADRNPADRPRALASRRAIPFVASAAAVLTAFVAPLFVGQTGRGQDAAAPAVEPIPATRPATTRRAATGPAAAARLAAKPPLTPAEHAAQAAELRAAYGKPPAEWPKATIDDGVEFVELGLIRRPTFPPDNPFTEAKAELGKTLFFDPRLSGSAQIACASCHEPELGWGDGRAVSFGHGRSPLKRNAPSLTNAASRKSFFWDGRAATLEDQAMEPLVASDEMNADPKKVIEALAAQPEYRRMFAEAFAEPAATQPATQPATKPAADYPADVVTIDRMAKALATYERTITSRASNFDRFLVGKHDALSDSAVRGLHLFRTQARCVNCHMGPTLTDEKFHNLGLTYYGRALEDLGRYKVTNDPADVGKFKTPTLRNIPRTGPYMHNGLFDLPGLMRIYNVGTPTIRRRPDQADDKLFPTKSPLLKPLGLNVQDMNDLLVFLESLEETRLRVRPPYLPGIGTPPATRPALRPLPPGPDEPAE